MSRRAKPHLMRVEFRTEQAGILYYAVSDPTRARLVNVRVSRQNPTSPTCLTHNSNRCEHCAAVLLFLVDHELPPLPTSETAEVCQS